MVVAARLIEFSVNQVFAYVLCSVVTTLDVNFSAVLSCASTITS